MKTTIEAPEPLIQQRADPFILKREGVYHFVASVPEYDRLEIRRSATIAGLAHAEPAVVWRKPDAGPCSALIWAPELHFLEGAWYIYFAAAPSREIKDDLFQHRMYAIECKDADPLRGRWSEPLQIETGMDSFCLDATAFYHRDALYYLWAQKDPRIAGNSNLYIARMDTPLRLATPPARLSAPTYDWECVGFKVNEGPAVVKRGDRIFITYSASATDENYCMGLLMADASSDLLSASSWAKSNQPVFRSAPGRKMFGPGHNSFTKSEDDQQDVLVYHCRNYTEIQGDPLWDPNRHTYVKRILWDSQGFPIFGEPGL